MNKEYKNKPILEKEFKKRYNRKIKVDRAYPDPALESTELKIITPKGTEVVLTEYREKGATIKTTIQVGDKTYVYGRYVDAELHLADLIGEEEDGDNN